MFMLRPLSWPQINRDSHRSLTQAATSWLTEEAGVFSVNFAGKGLLTLDVPLVMSLNETKEKIPNRFRFTEAKPPIPKP